jgi:MoaA/NifB/PqqE/SkfB family radical SAM enzyme
MSAHALAHQPHHPPLQRLPLVTLYATDRCNSRCITCDYWRQGKTDLSVEFVRALLPSLHSLDTTTVLLSGGEPLLNPAWPQIAELLRAHGLRVWLLTSGLSLAKHALRAAALFDDITVSLDGTDGPTYAAIRGLDAFDTVCDGIRAVSRAGRAPGIRVTLQRANHRQLAAFVDLARSLGARSVSFLAVDVANPQAFARGHDPVNPRAELALATEDLALLDQAITSLEHTHGDDFRSGFILENPPKLRRLLQYFSAIRGRSDYPAVRCNAPEFSAVIGADRRVQPCFFIAGPADAAGSPDARAAFSESLNSPSMRGLRAAIRRGERAECRTCVCSLWRPA